MDCDTDEDKFLKKKNHELMEEINKLKRTKPDTIKKTLVISCMFCDHDVLHLEHTRIYQGTQRFDLCNDPEYFSLTSKLKPEKKPLLTGAYMDFWCDLCTQTTRLRIFKYAGTTYILPVKHEIDSKAICEFARPT